MIAPTAGLPAPTCGCRHAAVKIGGCKAMYGDGDHAMSLVRNGFAVSCNFWGVLFSALLALALFDQLNLRQATPSTFASLRPQPLCGNERSKNLAHFAP